MGRKLLENVDRDLLRRTRGCIYSAGYHIVWCPKYRKKLYDSHAFKEAAKFHIKESCTRNEIELFEMECDRDHIHVFVGFPPRRSGAWAVNCLKGYSSKHLREGFPELARITGKEQLWSPGYAFFTIGSVNATKIEEYIRNNAGKSDDPAPSP